MRVIIVKFGMYLIPKQISRIKSSIHAHSLAMNINE